MFYAFFRRVLYFWGGGSYGGFPLSAPGGVTGSGRIVWMTVDASILGGIQACSRCVDITRTLGSNGIVNFGIGDAGLGCYGVDVWKLLESWCKAFIWESPNVANGGSSAGLSNVLTSLGAV